MSRWDNVDLRRFCQLTSIGIPRSCANPYFVPLRTVIDKWARPWTTDQVLEQFVTDVLGVPGRPLGDAIAAATDTGRSRELARRALRFGPADAVIWPASREYPVIYGFADATRVPIRGAMGASAMDDGFVSCRITIDAFDCPMIWTGDAIGNRSTAEVEFRTGVRVEMLKYFNHTLRRPYLYPVDHLRFTKEWRYPVGVA